MTLLLKRSVTGRRHGRMKQIFRALILAAALFGGSQIVTAAEAPPAGWPANLRWNLVSKWISWDGTKANISWPPNDGCAAAPVAETLPAGAMIDRFGSEGGTFFSPRGESFKSRAVPYVCDQMDYRVYKVLKPLPVQACTAAPWFGEPGGAKQVQSADPAYKLVAAQIIEAVSYEVGGRDGPYPQCGRP